MIYKVYVLTDENGIIIAPPASSAFLTDAAGWTQVDEGSGYRFQHCQGNYFDKPIMTNGGIYRYRLIDGVVIEKTGQEIAAEVEALPPPQTAPETALMSMVIDHEFRIIMMEMGV